MDRRARAASVAAVTATLLTGGVAIAATTGALASANPTNAGTVRLVDQSRGGSDPVAATSAAPSGPSGAAAGAAPATASPVPAGKTELAVAPAASVSAAANDGSGGPPPPSATGSGSTDGEKPSPTTQPTPPATPPPTVSEPPPTSGGWNCSGSDDGLTEAQKQAREAACQGAGDD